MHVNAQEVLTARTPGVDLTCCVVLPIDVGKHEGLVGVEDFTGTRLCRPILFVMTRDGIAAMVAAVNEVLPTDPVVVRAGVEVCGHYHQPVIAAGCCPRSGRWWSSTRRG